MVPFLNLIFFIVKYWHIYNNMSDKYLKLFNEKNIF